MTDRFPQFIHDPLINWRLGTQESPDRVSLTAERRQSIIEGINFEHGVQPSNFSRHRRPSILESGGILDTQEAVPAEAREAQNARALQVLARVKEKLTGRDFKHHEELNISDQVDRLLAQATNVENICQHWIGWCSFW